MRLTSLRAAAALYTAIGWLRIAMFLDRLSLAAETRAGASRHHATALAARAALAARR